METVVMASTGWGLAQPLLLRWPVFLLHGQHPWSFMACVTSHFRKEWVYGACLVLKRQLYSFSFIILSQSLLMIFQVLDLFWAPVWTGFKIFFLNYFNIASPYISFSFVVCHFIDTERKDSSFSPSSAFSDLPIKHFFGMLPRQNVWVFGNKKGCFQTKKTKTKQF